MKITLTNAEIYELTETLKANALGEKTYIPVMFNFYIQKNIKILYTLREEIDRCRNQILSHYGQWNDEHTKMFIPAIHVGIAQEELTNLENIVQDIELYAIPLTAFNGLCLTTGELKGLMPMLVGDPEMEKRLLSENPTDYERVVPVVERYN